VWPSLLRSKSALIGIAALDFASFSNGKKKEKMKEKCYLYFGTRSTKSTVFIFNLILIKMCTVL